LAESTSYQHSTLLIWNNIGAALTELGRYEEAIEYYNKVLTALKETSDLSIVDQLLKSGT
jgi:tetratricopeptide (TPR) repeat protein